MRNRGTAFPRHGNRPAERDVVDAAAALRQGPGLSAARSSSCRRKGWSGTTFFQNYLEDDDEMLARDAYDEFAKASYDTVGRSRSRWITKKSSAGSRIPNIPASRRRLYLVMLGICGSEKDLPMLEEFIKSEDRKEKVGARRTDCLLYHAQEGSRPAADRRPVPEEQEEPTTPTLMPPSWPCVSIPAKGK